MNAPTNKSGSFTNRKPFTPAPKTQAVDGPHSEKDLHGGALSSDEMGSAPDKAC